MFTTGQPSDPTSEHSYAIPAGTWCLSIQAEMKAVKKALQITQIKESHKKDQIVCGGQSTLLRIANLQPAISLRSAVESDILNTLAALHDEEYRINFTWNTSNCGVMGNEIADEQTQKGAEANLEGVRHHYDSGRPPSGVLPEGGGGYLMKEFVGCLAQKLKT